MQLFNLKNGKSMSYKKLSSLAWKGLSLERRLGSPRFFLTVSILTIASRFEIRNVIEMFTIAPIQHVLCLAGTGGLRVVGGLLHHEAVCHRWAANQPENSIVGILL